MTLSETTPQIEGHDPAYRDSLPYITASLPGIGGEIRTSPAHFVVEEIPLYAPAGEGQHLYVNLSKTGLTTKDVQQHLARALKKHVRDVGFAGMKDKFAQTTQTFSVNVQHAPTTELAPALYALEDALPITIHWIDRHVNKLKPGHLLGNRFRIAVAQMTCDGERAAMRAAAVATELRRLGLPNYFGPQRFGDGGKNVERGLALLQQRTYVKDRWLRRFLLSAYQSYLCNLYLAHRLESGLFHTLFAGDIAKKYATGGLFLVEDQPAEQARFAAQEISFTAPLFGPKMRAATGEAGELEAAILAAAPVTLEDFARAKVDGSRRLGRLLVPDLNVSLESKDGEEVLVVEFFLPKGAFATNVLRELMKVEPGAALEMDSVE